MTKTALVNMMIDIPDDEQYPETYIMQRLRDSLCGHSDKDAFWNEFQIDMDFLNPKKQQ